MMPGKERPLPVDTPQGRGSLVGQQARHHAQQRQPRGDVEGFPGRQPEAGAAVPLFAVDNSPGEIHFLDDETEEPRVQLWPGDDPVENGVEGETVAQGIHQPVEVCG